MAEIVNMPKLGFDMAEGTLVRWVKAEGEEIERGQVLAEIETDKATVEVESQATGVILRHLAEEGTALPVGDPIAVVGEAGEEVDVDALLGEERAEAAEPEPEPSPEAEQAGEPAPAAEQRAAPSRPPEGDGRYPGGVKATPVARRIAEEKDVDLQALSGSGPGGRIVKKDVEEAIEREPAPRPDAAPAFAAVGEPRETQRVEASRLRQIIGKRMSRSKQELPHFYVTVDVDAAPMMELRRQANEILPEEQKLSVNDFIVKAAALALRQFPNLNASLEGDEIVRHGEVNIGIAVAVEGGLMTVVVREADLKPLRTISQEARTMAQRARDGRVRSEDVEGSTFTVSNLGMFDVDHFIAIINPPEAAILATGSVRSVPVVEDDELTIGQRLKVTLSADHRVTDGAEAARWLQVFREMIEAPLRLTL